MLLACIAAGIPFLRWDTTAAKVLFVNLEIHRAFMRRRLQLMKEALGLANLDNLRIWTLRGQDLDFETLVPEIIERAKQEYNNTYRTLRPGRRRW
jgi:RecA-family ATPase